MLNIDRVDIQTDILPGPLGTGGPVTPEPSGSTALLAREQFRTAVLDVLRDHLRELDRSGMA